MKLSTYYATITCSCVLSVWLVAQGPVALVGGGYDDFLFVKLANSIAAGRWLGPFDQLTLSKGPFFPIFLAGTIVAGCPVHTAIQAVYLSGALLLSTKGAGCISTDKSKQRLFAAIGFFLLAANPATFDLTTSQLLREDIYAGLTLVLFSMAKHSLVDSLSKTAAIFFGVTLACFWMTREEGILLVAPLTLFLFWGWSVRNVQTGKKVIQVLIITIAATVPVLLICCINFRDYGVFRTCDFQSGPFPKAYGALLRVNHNRWTRYVPISNDALDSVYRISPTARQIQPFLANDVGKYWTAVGCDAHPIQDCHDLQAGWFMWALRDAVTHAGRYSSARDADAFYRSLAQQINAGCNEKLISCSGSRTGYMPPLQGADIWPIIQSGIRLTGDLMRLNDPSPTVTPTLAQGVYARAYDRVTSGSIVSPPEALESASDYEITGWISGSDKPVSLGVSAPPGTSIQSDIRLAQPVSKSQNSSAKSTHFSSSIRCQPGGCELQAISSGSLRGEWPITSLKPSAVVEAGGVAVRIESVSVFPPYTTTANLPTLRRHVMNLLSLVVPASTELTLIPATLWFCRCIFIDMRARRFRPVTILAAALLLVVLPRIAMLAVLDATSIPLERRYLTPALAPTIYFIMLMGSDLILRVRDTYRRLKRSATPAYG